MPERPTLPFGRPSFGEAELAAVARVLRSGWVGLGPETLAFEQELAAYVGASALVAVNSCTSGLTLALRLLGVGAGDEVVVPSLTWCSTANAVLYCGATPVFADVDAHSLCLDAASVSSALSPRTKAVIVVHFGGACADTEALKRCLPAGVHLVEDAAHALGSRYADGRPMGSSGNATCFSFYANKSLSTADGGAIAIGDADAAERLRSLRSHGVRQDSWGRFTHSREALLLEPLESLGYKAGFNDVLAAIGRVQLARQAEFAATRAAAARVYREALAPLPLHFQAGSADAAHANHLFTVMLQPGARLGRDALMLALRERGFGATVHYPPLHRMPLYQREARAVALPQTESIAERILTLPIGACVSTADAQAVAAAMHSLLT
jgi:perosamine synthetase